MIKHKWKEDACIHCGVRREMKRTTLFVRTISYLSRSGIFEDKNIYDERMRYHYFDLDGQSIGVERPECKKMKCTSSS